MGHEYVHVANFTELGSSYNSAYSEYAAYMWNEAIAGQNFGIDAYQETKWCKGYVSNNGKWVKGFNPSISPEDKGTLNKIVKPLYMRYGTYGLYTFYPNSFWYFK